MSDEEKKQPTVEDLLGGLSFTDLDEAGGAQTHNVEQGENPYDFPLPNNEDIQPGYNRTFDKPDFSEAQGEPAKAEEAEAEPQAEEVQEEPQEVSEEQEVSTDAETPAESETPDHKVLSPEELENIFIETNVYGEKKMVPIKEIQANYQKYMAGDKKLNESKEFMEQLKTFQAQLQAQANQPAQQTQPEPDEFEDPTTKELRELKMQFNQMQTEISTRETQRLAAVENQRVTEIMGDRDQNDVMLKIERIKASDPGAAAEINDLMRGDPTDEGHMNRRLYRFKTLINEIDRMDSPQVIQKVVEQAKAEGEMEAKSKSKQKLVNVSGGTPGPTSDGGSKDTMVKNAQSRDPDAQAEFIYRNFPSILGEE